MSWLNPTQGNFNESLYFYERYLGKRIKEQQAPPSTLNSPDNTASSDSSLVFFSADSLKIYIIIGCNLASEYAIKGNITVALNVLLNTLDMVAENIRKLQRKNRGRPPSSSTTNQQTSEAKAKTTADKDQFNFLKSILSLNISNLLVKKRKYSNALPFSKTAIQKFSFYGNSTLAVFFVMNYATVLAYNKNYLDAIPYLADALILIRFSKYFSQRDHAGSSSFSLERVWLNASPDPKDDYLKLEGLYEKNWDLVLKVHTYHNYALCKAHLENYGKAVKFCEKSYEMAKQLFGQYVENGVMDIIGKTVKFAKRAKATASAYAGNILGKQQLFIEPEFSEPLQTVTDVKRKLISILPYLGTLEGFSEIHDEDPYFEEDELKPLSAKSTQSTSSKTQASEKFLLKSSLKNTIVAARTETSAVPMYKKRLTPQKPTTPSSSRVVLPPVKKKEHHSPKAPTSEPTKAFERKVRSTSNGQKSRDNTTKSKVKIISSEDRESMDSTREASQLQTKPEAPLVVKQEILEPITKLYGNNSKEELKSSNTKIQIGKEKKIDDKPTVAVAREKKHEPVEKPNDKPATKVKAPVNEKKQEPISEKPQVKSAPVVEMPTIEPSVTVTLANENKQESTIEKPPTPVYTDVHAQAAIKIQLMFRRRAARKIVAKQREHKRKELDDFLAEERKWFEEHKNEFDHLLSEGQ